MKQALAAAALLIVLVFGYLLYKNVAKAPVTPEQPITQACQQDAKVCPDGASLGRSGPACTFPACPPPNAELASVGVGFVLPVGYTENKNALGNDSTLIAAYEKPAKASAKHALVVRDYLIAAGKTATSTILANTMFESSGATATSMSQFTKKTIGTHTFYCVTLERFEGQIHTACYLPRAADVLRFEVLEKDVDWTNPNLVIETLPEHKAFYAMLKTLTP